MAKLTPNLGHGLWCGECRYVHEWRDMNVHCPTSSQWLWKCPITDTILRRDEINFPLQPR